MTRALHAPQRRPPPDQAFALRSLVARAAPDQPPRPPAPARRAPVVGIASGKGGVGKTTVAVNLAIALASRRDPRITLVDADLGMANADVMCGLSPARRLDRIITPPRDGPAPDLRAIAVDAPGGFRLVPGSVGIARMAHLGPDERATVIAALADLERDSDLILVDNGAGIGRGVLAMLNAADLALVVATPEPTSIADAYALIKCLLTQGRYERAQDRQARDPRVDSTRPSIALVINQVKNRTEAAEVHTRIAGVCAKFLGYPLPLLGWISQDVRVGRAVRRRRPLLIDSPRSIAGKDLRRIARSLPGHIPQPGPQTDAGPNGAPVARWMRAER